MSTPFDGGTAFGTGTGRLGTMFGTGTGNPIGGGGGGTSGGVAPNGNASGSGINSGFLKVLGTVLSPAMIAAYRNAITGGVGAATLTTASGQQIRVVGTSGGKLYQVGTPNAAIAAGVQPGATVDSTDNSGTLIIALGIGAAALFYFSRRR